MAIAALNINLDYNQIVNLVKQLSVRDRIRLSRELTKDTLVTEMQYYLDRFRTNELSEKEILSEVESVRQDIYDQKK